jgi:hypothetical protein
MLCEPHLQGAGEPARRKLDEMGEPLFAYAVMQTTTHIGVGRDDGVPRSLHGSCCCQTRVSTASPELTMIHT